MGKNRAFLVSFMNELSGQSKNLELEMKSRYEDITSRLVAIENRLDDLSRSVEIRHADMWKFLVDMNASLPMTVAMSVSEVLAKMTEEVKSDIADSRVEISGLLHGKKLSDG